MVPLGRAVGIASRTALASATHEPLAYPDRYEPWVHAAWCGPGIALRR